MRRAFEVNMVGVVENGLLERIWAIESDQSELVETKESLKRRQDFQQLVADVSARLVMALDAEADAVVEECMGEVCTFLDVDRSSIFWLDELGGNIPIAYSWRRAGYELGDSVITTDFPQFTAELLSKQVVRVDSVDLLDDKYCVEKQRLQKMEVKAAVLLPLVIAGEVVGGMAASRVRNAVAWTDQDIQDLTRFSELFANFVLRLKSHRALIEALSGLRRATDRLEAENVYLREEIELTHGFDDIIGQSRSILRSLQLVEQVADTMTPVLIFGETGTGKELVARALHELSDRRDHPLVKVNCAALPANLIESELFGHEKGAFTGADSAKRGRFDLAAGSTLFLDEIGEIPVELQSKLLRVLQEGEFERLGGTKTIKVDVRIVVATNRDLDDAVLAGEFRSDLYYRINTFPIEIPPLRDRGGDIELLARHFVRLHAKRLRRDVQEISSEMIQQLHDYQWPGNVRELEGIIQRALILSTGPVLNLAEPLVTSEFDDSVPKIVSTTIAGLKLVERDHIISVLDASNWKISGDLGASAQLGLPPSTLRSKMKKLGIVRPK